MDDGVWINETFQTSSCYPIIGVFAVTKTLVVRILHFLNYIKSETKMKRTKEKKNRAHLPFTCETRHVLIEKKCSSKQNENKMAIMTSI